VTFYRNEALREMPDFTDYSMENRTYRYYRGEPLYPFGYGLSYGRCTITELRADRDKAEVTVRNDGPLDTDEVVEIYLKDEGSPLAPPNPVLCGFRRIRLGAGEETSVSVAIDPGAFTVVNGEGRRIPGSGTWRLYAGFGAPDPRTEALTGRTAVSVPLTK
jgi:beta-glucosidase